jgi:hypothetical protein
MALAWLDEFQTHRLHDREILLVDRLDGPAPLLDIPTGAADEADIGIGIHGYLDVE